MKVQIIGTGLIGTSIGLRLRAQGHRIALVDKDKSNLKFAQDLIKSENMDAEDVDLIVIATPIESLIEIFTELKLSNLETTVIDITGVKSKVLLEVEKFPELARNYVSCHPMAGREFTGPASARSDLFEGRAWLITPTSVTERSHVQRAEFLGVELGSTVYVISAEKHDEMIAAVSQMPQVISSLMASLLNSQSEESLNFAGQGLRDVTRLADSDSNLWSHLIANNVGNLTKLIDESIHNLKDLSNALTTGNVAEIKKFFESGNVGRQKIPGKHGAKARAYSFLPIVIPDKPGQLAKIIAECADCGVNIEDLSIEHSPNQETGLVTLALSDNDAIKLKAHMQSKGWLAQEIRK